MMEEKREEGWELVEKYLNEEIECGFNMAVLEVHKKLSEVLREKKFPGKDFKDKLKSAKSIFTDKEKLEAAMEKRERMLEEVDFRLSKDEAREIISAYYQAIVDLRDYVKKEDLRWWERWRLNLKKLDLSLGRWPKYVVLAIFLFFLMVFLLDRTSIGKEIVKETIMIANFIFTKLIIGIFVGAAVLALLIAAIYLMNPRAEAENNKEEDDDEEQ
jgi:hypothetical protein